MPRPWGDPQVTVADGSCGVLVTCYLVNLLNCHQSLPVSPDQPGALCLFVQGGLKGWLGWQPSSQASHQDHTVGPQG